MIKTPVEQRWKRADVADQYDAERFERLLGRVYHRLQSRALTRCLRSVAAGARIVDIPCGTGRMLPLLASHTGSVIGMDVSETMMRYARRRLHEESPVSFAQGNAKAIPLADCSVDAVFCIRFAMHLTSAERGLILREFARVTRSHVIVEFGCDSQWHAVRRFLRSLVFKVLGRRRTYPSSVDRRCITAEARAAGLDVCAWHWTLRAGSESVFVHMRKRNAPAGSAGG